MAVLVLLAACDQEPESGQPAEAVAPAGSGVALEGEAPISADIAARPADAGSSSEIDDAPVIEEAPLSPAASPVASNEAPPPPSDAAGAAPAEPDAAIESEERTPVAQAPAEDAGEAVIVEVEMLPLLTLKDNPALLQRLADADPEAGWRYGQRCAGCHSFAVEGPGPAGPQLGPPLAGIYGGGIGTVEGFDYSPVFAALAETRTVWNAAMLDAFLAAPAEAIPGTAMDVGGIADPADRADVVAFLIELAEQRAAAVAVAETADVGDLVAAADLERGEQLAAQACGGCHRFAPDEPALIGPNLFDVVGKLVGANAAFVYSPAMAALNEAGTVWTYAFLDAFLASPAFAVPGTRMGMTGVPDLLDRAAIIAYLRQLAPDPAPLAVTIGTPVPGLMAVTYTDDQAEEGAGFYDVFGCGNCHGPDLRGDIDIGGFGDAPPLIGPSFQRRWFGRDLFALFAFLETEKAPNAPEEMNGTAIAALMAFMLQENGFRAGSEAISDDRTILEATGFFQ